MVFPQALRVIVPPLTSQYLNLVKNSSLAIAIGYPDLFKVGTTMANQTGQPVPVIVLVMGTYLAISLATSAAHEPLQPPRPGAGAMTADHRDPPPPRTASAPIAWLREEPVLGSIASSLHDRPGRLAAAGLAVEVGQWAVTEARWGVVTRNLRLFLIGQYPAEQAWRVWLCLLILSAWPACRRVFGRTCGRWRSHRRLIQVMLACSSLASRPRAAVVIGYGAQRGARVARLRRRAAGFVLRARC